jgi:hypothetical protein
MSIRRFMPFLTLLALPLVVGSSCAFFFSSGGGSSDRDDKDKDDENIIVAANSGRFGDPTVAGVSYESGSLSGITDSDGKFQYEAGKTVRFSIGEVDLGEPVPGKSTITPQDLVVEGAPDSDAFINISRLLQSLDSNPDDDIITIPKAVRTAAVRTNEDVSTAIEYLDFSNDSAFVNAATQLVAVLTQDYPHTATLVDADTVKKRRIEGP